ERRLHALHGAREDVAPDLVLTERVLADREARRVPRPRERRGPARVEDGVELRVAVLPPARDPDRPEREADRGDRKDRGEDQDDQPDHGARVPEEPAPDDLALGQPLDLAELDR